jgi:photosystem II stability/assembly factor-like uncharacterized protein
MKIHNAENRDSESRKNLATNGTNKAKGKGEPPRECDSCHSWQGFSACGQNHVIVARSLRCTWECPINDLTDLSWELAMRRFSRLQWMTVLTFSVLSVIAGPAEPPAQGPPSLIEGILDRLAFRSIGPATMGGRIDDLAVLENRPSTFYVGAATGGLWKTVNNGTTWEPVFDRQEVVSIGAVAIPSDNASLVWVGTGENNNRQSSSWGGGVFKSTDGGQTWKNMGLVESRHVGRIVIDPTNHDVVYVAAMGHLWGPNKERGVFKTADGGLTWTQSLFVDEQTGATELVMDPSDNKVLYAAMYQRQRAGWGYNGGGPGSGLYKSSDAGKTWNKLTSGIPAGALGRIALDVYRGDPKIVYALIQHESETGLYRSEDAGARWAKVGNTNPRPSYFSQVRIDPNDPQRIYVLGVRLMVSDDGGKTFKEVRVSYTRPGGERPRDDLDVHAMWVDPRDPSRLMIGSDVGIAISYDRGTTWDFVDNLPIGQFYHVGYDMDTPYRIYGGLQDNDVWGGPSAVRNRFGIANHDWFTLSIGDGFNAWADPRDPRTIYAETQDGNLARVDRDSNERKTIRPQAARGEPALRWSWDTPLIISPHDPGTLLIGANRIFRSTNRGDSWEPISPDLTSGVDRDTLSLMGVAGKEIRLSKNDGVSSYPTLVALAESPRKAGLYYAGADDGTMHVSRDAGKTWSNISGKFLGLPVGASAGRLVASAFNEATAYATFNNHRSDDYTPYVYVTTDYGSTWKSLASTLPGGQTVNCLTEDPKNADVLYLGTEFGLFVSFDRGQRWLRFRNNLPTVPIDEITIHPRENDMLLATHGRSIWILDDIAPIQQAAEALKTQAYLFDISPAVQFSPSNEHANYPGDRRFWGQNPEFGAAIQYYLKDTPDDIRITIRDAGGTMVRDLVTEDLKNARGTGLSRIYWDLRHQPVDTARGRSGQGPGGGGPGGGSAVPFVLPGDYRVTLTIAGREVGTRTVQVQGDPQIKISDADRRIHHDTALMLHELQRPLNEATAAINAAGEQVRAVQDLLTSMASPPPALKEAADALAKRLAGLTQQLGAGNAPAGGRGGGGGAQGVRGQLTAVRSQILAFTALPTAAQMQQARDSRDEVARLIADLNDLLTAALPALFKALADNKLQPPQVKPIPTIKLDARTTQAPMQQG